MMKGMLLFISLTLFGYGQTPTEIVYKTTDTEVALCHIFSEEFLVKNFPGAENFTLSAKEKPYPSCSYHFDMGGKHYFAGATLVEKYGSEANLDRVTERFKDREPLEGVGQKAYYIPNLGQVSLWYEKRLVHVFVQADEKGDKQKAIELTKRLLKKL